MPARPEGREATYAMNTEVPSLDPAMCGVTAFDRCSPIFGTLLRQDPDKNEFVGQMADSFTTTDGKAWTLKLREGVKFSDGTAFDARPSPSTGTASRTRRHSRRRHASRRT